MTCGTHTFAPFASLLFVATLTSAVSPAQILPMAAADYAARVETITGQVSVLRDNQPWALSSGDSVQCQQVIISGANGYALLRVSDGSTFEVYPNSRVTFRKNLGNWTISWMFSWDAFVSTFSILAAFPIPTKCSRPRRSFRCGERRLT